MYNIPLYICLPTLDITEQPQSVSALVGTAAQFHCAGTGNFLLLFWLVNGNSISDVNNNGQEIHVTTEQTDSGVQSNLTILASSENNGTSIQCALQALGTEPVYSIAVTLRVLPGVCFKLPYY